MTIPGKERLWFLDTLVIVHVASAQADGLSIIEHHVPCGSSPPLHVHQSEDEVFHLIAGTARFVVGGEERNVSAGDTFVGPKGVPHTYIVTSPEGASWLTITNKGQFEAMVRAVSRPAVRDGLPPALEIDDAQKAALDKACRANGIELVGPPLNS